MAFEFVTALSVAYDVKLIGISAKSSKHRRSRRQITRMQKCVAHLYLVQQMKLWTFIATRLGMFRAMFPNEQYTIMDDFESDETKQRLRLNLGGGRDMLASHQQQAPHVWVSRRTTRIQFWSGRVLILRWVAAPVPCLSTNAGSLHAVQFVLPGISAPSTYNRIFAKMAEDASDELKARTLDGAGGNGRVTHHEFLADEHVPHKFGVLRHCGMHNTSLGLGHLAILKAPRHCDIVIHSMCASLPHPASSINIVILVCFFAPFGSTAATVFPSLAQELHTGSKFFGMGAFWLRMVYCVPRLCDSMVRPTTEPRSALWARVANGLIGSLLLTHVVGLLFHDVTGKTGKPSWHDDLCFLFETFSGDLLSNGWMYHTTAPYDLEAIQRRFRAVIMRVILRRRPPIFSLSRWTVIGPSLDFYVLATVTKVLLPLVAVARMAIKKTAGGAGESCAAAEGEMVCDFNWESVAGVRADRLIKLLSSPDIVVRLLVFHFTVAAFRYVSAWLLFRTHESTCGPTPLLDWLHQEHSPITKVLQYLRSLLISLSSDRFICVLALAGYQERLGFVTSGSVGIELLCRSALVASAWIWLRDRKHRQSPYDIVQIVDSRVPRPVREGTAACWCARRRCRLDFAFGRKLRKRVRIFADLFEMRNQQLLTMLSFMTMHNAPVECLHARGQQHTHEASSWATFCSDFVNSEAVCFQDEADKEIQHMKSCATEDDSKSKSKKLGNKDEDKDKENTLPAGHSAVAVYHCRRLQAISAAGVEKCPSASDKPFWKQVRDDFDSEDVVSRAEVHTMEMIASHNASQPRAKKLKTSEQLALAPLKAEPQLVPGLCRHSIGLHPLLSNQNLDANRCCLRCGSSGAEHRPLPARAEKLMRVDDASVEATITGQETLSQFPMSATRFAQEKSFFKGGLDAIANQFSQSYVSVGRDLGGVPDKLPARKQCASLCFHEISANDASLARQLQQLFRDYVGHNGGEKGIVNVQPSPPYA